MGSDRKMRPVFYTLHALTLKPSSTPDQLAAALAACDAMQDRRRLSEGAVYATGCRRYLLDTGRDWRADLVPAGATTWTGSDHRSRVQEYPEGWAWLCSCGQRSTGRWATRDSAQHAHEEYRETLMRLATDRTNTTLSRRSDALEAEVVRRMAW